MHAYEMHAGEVHTYEIYAGEVHTNENAYETYAPPDTRLPDVRI